MSYQVEYQASFAKTWHRSGNPGSKDFTDVNDALEFAAQQHIGSSKVPENRLAYRVIIIPDPSNVAVIAVFGQVGETDDNL
jgi:hypothetical protein